ncbi:MAG: DUF6789 family protein [Pseudomonadota bacterium]
MVRAIFAGLIATAVISALIYANERMGFVPGVSLPADIAAFNARIGLPATLQAVWVTHALLGSVIYGIVYALLEPILPGRGGVAGLWFGVVTWLAMMVSFMPLAGHQIFAQDIGLAFAAIALGIHLLYGLILGTSYTALQGSN